MSAPVGYINFSVLLRNLDFTTSFGDTSLESKSKQHRRSMSRLWLERHSKVSASRHHGRERLPSQTQWCFVDWSQMWQSSRPRFGHL